MKNILFFWAGIQLLIFISHVAVLRLTLLTLNILRCTLYYFNILIQLQLIYLCEFFKITVNNSEILIVLVLEFFKIPQGHCP